MARKSGGKKASRKRNEAQVEASGLERALSYFPGAQPAGRGSWRARCLAHRDEKPSLSITARPDTKHPGHSRLLVKCHAGCSGEAVRQAHGFQWDDLRHQGGGEPAPSPEPAEEAAGEADPEPPRRSRGASPAYDMEQVLREYRALPFMSAAFRYITETRGISREVIKHRLIGYHGGDQRYAGITLPYFRDGEPTYRKTRVIDPPEDGSKVSRYPSGVDSHLYNADDLLPDGTVVVTEGEIDALSLETAGLPEGVAVVSVPDGVRSATQAVTTAPLRNQARVYVALDADEPGEEAARGLAAALGPERCFRLTFPGHKDANEALVALGAEGLRALLAERIAAAHPMSEAGPEGGAPPVEPDRRRVIDSSRQLMEVTDDAAALLGDISEVYQYGGRLVHLVRRPQDLRRGDLRWTEGPVSVLDMERHRLLELLGAAARWGRDENADGRPPMWVVDTLFARHEWPRAQRLRGIVDAPTLLPDGSILSTPGYHEASGLYYAPVDLGPVDVPAEPTQADARAAVARLLDVACDFPFQTPNDRAAWLAATLTPFAVWACGDNVPIVIVTANTPGAGKGLLLAVTGIIATGQPFQPTPAPPTEEECAKALITKANAGARVVFFDNVRGVFGWPSLEMVATSGYISGRLLGRNDAGAHISIPWRPIFFATGNNIEHPSVDTTRRVLPVRLESKEEKPEERKGFRHHPLEHHVAGRRAELVTAALTVLRGYCAAGRPTQDLPAWGSFQGWSDLVRSAVVWAGEADPAGHRAEYAQKTDREASLLARLYPAWQATLRDGWVSIGEVVTRMSPIVHAIQGTGGAAGTTPDEQALALALMEINGPRRDLSPGTLGQRLGRYENRILGGRKLEAQHDPSRNVKTWRVTTVGEVAEPLRRAGAAPVVPMAAPTPKKAKYR